MHEIFSTGFSVAGGVFRYLVEFDKKNTTENNPQSLLAIIMSILEDRGHLARVCREWSALLSNTQTLSLASLHFNAFGCRGTAIEIFARYTALHTCHFVSCRLEPVLFRPAIVKFLK